jgi:hypothetical protein
MKTDQDIRIGELIALVLLPVSIVIVRNQFNKYYPRDEFCWDMISWALAALAFSTVVVAILCALTGRRVGDISLRITRWTLAVVAIGGSSLVALFGFLNGMNTSEVVVGVVGWLAVSLSLFALLILPRLQTDKKTDSHNKTMEDTSS